MFKVALFMHDFAGGGVEKMRLALAQALATAGCKVSIIVVNNAGPLAGKIPPGVDVFSLGRSRLVTALPGLRRYLRDQKPDVMVSSLDHNNIAALCARATIRTPTRLIICQHNALSQERRLGWKYRAVPLLYRLLAKMADAIIAVSRGVSEDLASTAAINQASITVIHNPVISSGDVAAEEAPAPHPWLRDPSTPVFVFVGRLVAQKNPMMLIAAFTRHMKMHRARLIVLGDGPCRAAMLQAAQAAGVHQHIYFAGFVAEPRAWIARAHALLLTSSYEGFGNVIVEALACGTPVIATNCPYGPSEILEGGKHGILIAPGDEAGFAAAMALDLRARFSGASLRDRALDFTAEAAAANHIALFRRLCGARRRPVFGLSFTAKAAAEVAEQLIDENPAQAKLVVTPNIDHVRLLRSRPDFRAACLSADTVCADGWPVALYAALRGAAPGRRATGCDILHTLLTHEQVAERRILAVVESQNTATALTGWLASRGWTNWAVAVAPVNLARDRLAQMRLVNEIVAAQTQILIMTLGAPTSETFVHQNAASLPGCWAICVGQALRVEIGLTTRAPALCRRLGLEWAWRCAHEPLRLAPRYLRALLTFPVAAASDFLQPLTQDERPAGSLRAPAAKRQ